MQWQKTASLVRTNLDIPPYWNKPRKLSLSIYIYLSYSKTLKFEGPYSRLVSVPQQIGEINPARAKLTLFLQPTNFIRRSINLVCSLPMRERERNFYFLLKWNYSKRSRDTIRNSISYILNTCTPFFFPKLSFFLSRFKAEIHRFLHFLFRIIILN